MFDDREKAKHSLCFWVFCEYDQIVGPVADIETEKEDWKYSSGHQVNEMGLVPFPCKLHPKIRKSNMFL